MDAQPAVSSNVELDVVFLWHMHQPDYRTHENDSADFVMPWTYLHAIKDYSDMAAHLERHPHVRCIVNFVPLLLDQIEDYACQFEVGKFTDPLLRLLSSEKLEDMSDADKRFLLEACFRSNHHTMLTPFPQYKRLYDMHIMLTREGDTAVEYLATPYYSDLLTWYHLAWIGEAERRKNPLVAMLMSKGDRYDHADRKTLLGIIGKLLKEIIPRYQALAARGQIELTCTPQTHPLGPLLIDFKVARESEPTAKLPLSMCYPGGHDRLDFHLNAAMRSHSSRFGGIPLGMWPAEGAISTAFALHACEHGFKWMASGERVLHNSLRASGTDEETIKRSAYQPWQIRGVPDLTVFFRDERLSDLIGFDYAKWHGRDAAQHLVGELEKIRLASAAGERPVVGIIMDGENAWEHYPYNAFYFFDDLYSLLRNNEHIRTCTYSDVLQRMREENKKPEELPSLVAGSWVFGTMSTWIGDAQKNRAWDLLCAAKQSYDLVLSGGRLDETQIRRASQQLSSCESSDWFWWFGDYNPAESVVSFDRLFRHNLAQLYRCLQLEPPITLSRPISSGSRHQQIGDSGVMRRSNSH